MRLLDRVSPSDLMDEGISMTNSCGLPALAATA